MTSLCFILLRKLNIKNFDNEKYQIDSPEEVLCYNQTNYASKVSKNSRYNQQVSSHGRHCKVTLSKVDVKQLACEKCKICFWSKAAISFHKCENETTSDGLQSIVRSLSVNGTRNCWIRLDKLIVQHFQCDICQRHYSSKDLRSKHMKKCEDLTQKLLRRISAGNHLSDSCNKECYIPLSKLDVKSFKCDICKVYFYSKEVTRLHKNGGCKSSSHFTYLNTRAQGKHKLYSPNIEYKGVKTYFVSNEPFFQCSVCSSVFRNEGSLIKHFTHAHDNSKYFKCLSVKSRPILDTGLIIS